MQLNDAIRAALGPGHINDSLLRYYQDGGATSDQIDDAKAEWLAIVFPTGTGDVNDDWFNYLGSLGHTGQINDRELQYWQTILPPTVVDSISDVCGLTRRQVRKIIRKTRRGRSPSVIALQLGLPIADVMCVINKLP